MLKINIKGKTLQECDFNERVALSVVDSYYRSMYLVRLFTETSSLATVTAISTALRVKPPEMTSWDPIYAQAIRGSIEDFANAYFPEYAFEFEEPAPSSTEEPAPKEG